LAAWVAATFIVFEVTQITAQGPPPLRPKDPPATLLILCDLACNYKLDGAVTGHINADSSAKVKVELGEHLVVAVTEDGLDQIKQKIEVTKAGQTLVDIALKPIREARLIANPVKPAVVVPPADQSASLLVSCDLPCTWSLDGEVKGTIEADGSTKQKVDIGQHRIIAVTADGLDKITQTAEAKAATQTLVPMALKAVRDLRIKSTPDPAVVAKLAWVDPLTQLMWATKDNGRNTNWSQAAEYCRSLQLGNHANWRLATIDELKTLFDPNANVLGRDFTGTQVYWHVRGEIDMTGWEWSQSQADVIGEAWGLSFIAGKRQAGRVSDAIGNRALCVRRLEN